jgi:SHS2 domain-containing protein
MNASPPFEFVEGATSDLAFVARGGSCEAALAAAAEALLAATVEDPAGVEPRETRRVELAAPDLDLLLLRFLNELVYLRDAERLLLRPRRLEVEESPGEARLRAELVGERIDRSRHDLVAEVKAATAHGLRVSGERGRYRATVTLDV